MIKPICPRDLVPLERKLQNGVVRHACPSCLGFSVNFAAARNLFSAAEVSRFWTEALRAPRGRVPCTHCRQPMNVLAPPRGLDHSELDFCPRCHLLWFDTGEWSDVKGRAWFTASHRPAMTQDLTREYAKALLAMEEERQRNVRPSFEPNDDVPVHKLAIAIAGLPVEEETDWFAAKPVVTWSALAACVLVTTWATLRSEFVFAHFAYRPGLPVPLGVLRALTSFFLHANLVHLLGNMYYLWVFGDNCEDELGRERYLVLLTAATLAGCLSYAWFSPSGSERPLVGASGGIAGLIAFYVARFPHRRFLILARWRAIAVPAWAFGALYVLRALVGSYVQMNGVTSTSHLTHLGGAAVGLIFGWWVRR